MGKNYYLKDKDILDQALEHSWGKSAEAKAKERAYNREYYQRHKEEILRKARQAGEGIQRTAQNAYNTARREAQGIRDAVNPQPRQYSNPKGWKGGRDDTLWGLDKYVDGAYKERIDEARKNRNLAKNTPGAAETERRYRNAMRARSQAAAAVNEALKDGRQLAPDSRFDSKLVRDAQNAYSKLRNPKEMARRAGESAKNAVNNTRDYIDTATGKKGRRRGQNIDVRNYDKTNSMNARLSNEARERYNTASNDAVETARTARNYHQGRGHNPTYNKAYDEYLGRTANDVMDASNRAYKNQRRMANRSTSSGAALNEAQKARDNAYRGYDSRYDNKLARDLQNTKAKARGAMTKAEKAAQQAREDAKKRMKKWFNR